jgi:phospholipid/cholesterol/gamma-HCH transport system substrate-binding protein
MISRLVKIQLVVFVIIAVVGIVFVGAKYARLPTLFGKGEFPVYADFEDAGGIFQNAEVTYRGTPVGLVGKMSLVPGGTRVELLIKDSAPQIPSSAVAVVANRSAAGEQYVDLQPPTDEGPYLTRGSVLSFENGQTESPVNIAALLNGLHELSESIPLDKFREVVQETGEMFNGRGEDLGTIIDSLDAFSQEAIDAMPETLQLLRDGATVLQTQAEDASKIQAFSRDLGIITSQLQASDQDIRRIIRTSTNASDSVTALLNRSGASLTELLANTEPVAGVLGERGVYLRPILQFLPGLGAGAYTVLAGDDTAHFGLILEVNNPPACTLGYEATHQRIAALEAADPSFDPSLQEWEWDRSIGCDVAQGNPTGVRGAARAIFADPTVPQPWDDNPKQAPDSTDFNPYARQVYELLNIVGG